MGELGGNAVAGAPLPNSLASEWMKREAPEEPRMRTSNPNSAFSCVGRRATPQELHQRESKISIRWNLIGRMASTARPFL